MISIKREVEAVKRALGEDEFATSVLASISSQGHYSIESQQTING